MAGTPTTTSGAPSPRGWARGLAAAILLLQAATGTGEPAAGADTWWSFQPVKPPTPPHVANPRWVQSPVDTFILARMEASHGTPAPRADRRTLLRRVTFDLTGLPPTPEEITSFLADASPRAFENVVERLLASPRYGERWGRHWMDIVRYADTAGDNADYPVPEARLYRDYIIDAFNADKPYDQFVCEQLAGDLIAREGPAERTAERIIATGFLALSRRYATAPFELMHLTVEDAIETTGRAFLGMTPRCARCHDHKYDPLTRTDYYGMYGFFASTRFPYAGSEEFQSKNLPRTGFVPLVGEEAGAQELEANRRRVAELKAAVSQAEAATTKTRTNVGARTEDGGRLAALRLELKQRERLGHAPGLPVAYGVTDDRPVDQAIHLRGDPATPGPVVPRCLPRFLAGGTPLAIKPGTSGRLEFARWIADAANPLTARVMVNRIWQHHFGRGLVGTPSNFGLRGETPTHPELLDYLADAFVRGGWSVKAMHRLILNSATWQQSDTPSDPALDPANRLYTRFERQRLDAESIRDAMLMVSGTLDLSRPGAHPFPPVEDWHWTQHNPFKAVYESRHRSVYLMRQRLQRHPYLALFDAPDANTPVDVRTHATVPPQSLYLMNNPFVVAQADAFARRAAGESAEGRGRAARMVLRAWGRPPTPIELRAATGYIEQFTTEARREGVTPEDADREAWRSYGRVLLGSNEFLYID